MLARDRDVLHAGRLRQGDPLDRIERDRIELRRQLFVIGDGIFRLFITHSPSPSTL
jgi:hypothetical protein